MISKLPGICKAFPLGEVISKTFHPLLLLYFYFWQFHLDSRQLKLIISQEWTGYSGYKARSNYTLCPCGVRNTIAQFQWCTYFIPILKLFLTNISSRGRLSSRKKSSALNSSVSKLKELYEAVLEHWQNHQAYYYSMTDLHIVPLSYQGKPNWVFTTRYSWKVFILKENWLSMRQRLP